MAESARVDRLCEGGCGKMMYGVDKKRRICSGCRREKEKLYKRARRESREQGRRDQAEN